MSRTWRSFWIIFGVVPEAIREWKPDNAPQAIVMNRNGNREPAPKHCRSGRSTGGGVSGCGGPGGPAAAQGWSRVARRGDGALSAARSDDRDVAGLGPLLALVDIEG